MEVTSMALVMRAGLCASSRVNNGRDTFGERVSEMTSRQGPSWSAFLPRFEGNFDGELEVTADGPVFEIVLITHNPNYGGASGLGVWSLPCLEAVSPLPRNWSDTVEDLRQWARGVVAAARPPFSAQAAEVLAEPAEEALTQCREAVVAQDLAALRLAYRRAPAALDRVPRRHRSRPHAWRRRHRQVGCQPAGPPRGTAALKVA